MLSKIKSVIFIKVHPEHRYWVVLGVWIISFIIFSVIKLVSGGGGSLAEILFLPFLFLFYQAGWAGIIFWEIGAQFLGIQLPWQQTVWGNYIDIFLYIALLFVFHVIGYKKGWVWVLIVLAAILLLMTGFYGFLTRGWR